MKKLFSHHNPMVAGQLESLLEAQGIPCALKNHYLSGAAGELPPTDCWPEVWVVEDTDYARAMKLLQGFNSEPKPGRPAWTCPHCGEWLEGQFDACWSCAQPRDP